MMITGILLAAGFSRRFGSQKLIATLPSGLPIAVASWRALKEAHDNSIAVIRHDDSILKAIFEREKIAQQLLSVSFGKYSRFQAGRVTMDCRNIL